MMRYFLFLFLCIAAPIMTHANNFLYVTSEGEIVVNDINLGYGDNPVVVDNDYAYETMKNDGVHVIFNGKDMGKGFKPQIDSGKLLFETEVNFKNTIWFDGKNYGEGYNPKLKDGNFVFYRKEFSKELQNVVQGRVFIYYNGAYYCDAEEVDVLKVFQFEGKNVICEQKIQSPTGTVSYVVYNGVYIDEGYDVRVSKSHYAYLKKTKYGTKDVAELYVDGVNLGEGYNLSFSENAFIFLKKNFEGREEIFYNGKNLGTFIADSIVFNDGNLAFLRQVTVTEYKRDGTKQDKVYNELIYNGVKRGYADVDKNFKGGGKRIFVSKEHLAFERKNTIQEIVTSDTDKDLTLDSQGREVARTVEKQISFAVFNGRERSEIIEGSLRMKDGYFAFAKLVEVKKEDEDYTRRRYLYYKDNVLGQNPTRDQEFSLVTKYIYTKVPYIFSGTPDGNIKMLTEGDPNTLVVADGKVAYVKDVNVEVSYRAEGETRKRLEKKSHIFINGSDRGEGDITTLFMDKGQYGFARNVQGRYMMVINAKERSLPGKKVYFIGNKESSVGERTLLSNLASPARGTVLKAENNRFVFVPTGTDTQYTIRYIDMNQLEGLRRKSVVMEFRLIRGILLVTKIEEDRVLKANEYQGTLVFHDGAYYLQTSPSNRYRLSLNSRVREEDIAPYINDVVIMEFERPEASNPFNYRVLSFKKR